MIKINIKLIIYKYTIEYNSTIYISLNKYKYSSRIIDNLKLFIINLKIINIRIFIISK